MISIFENSVWRKAETIRFSAEDRLVCLLSVDELEKVDGETRFDKTVVTRCLQRESFTFEHQDTMDYVGLLFFNMNKPNESGVNVCVCSGDHVLIIVYENSDQASAVIREIIAESHEYDQSKGNLFISFLEKIIVGHIEQHEIIEDEIALLEDLFLTDRKNVGPGRILKLQKKLLAYKRFYEQFQHILDDVQEAKHGLIEEENLRPFIHFARRLDRLHNNVLVLREYVTQVRESYEAETDISLNKIMRLFTVVTVIFLPLTLLVGWYGMNLKMPEFQWEWSYPAIIFVSLIIIVVTILIFKKKKWF